MDRGFQIIEKAKEMGAAMAGIADVEALKRSASHEILKKEKNGIVSVLGIGGMNEIKWPEKAKAAVVVAVSHPQNTPQLDWFDAFGSSPGNRDLIRINQELSGWIEETFGVETHKMPYHVEHGGIYLKDAAVLAGLGCIGRNNLLVTPELGSRVRLRAMLLEDELTPTGPIALDPCDGCEELCRKACPQNAYEKKVLSSDEIGMDTLPGRDGFFNKAKCMIQIGNDIVDSGIDLNEMKIIGLDTAGESQTEERIKYCRRCEFACPPSRAPSAIGFASSEAGGPAR
jgi:epoxyqueuosine reductase